MITNPKRMREWRKIKHWVQRVVAVVVAIVGLVTFADEYLRPVSGLPALSQLCLRALLIPIGLGAGFGHALLWAAAERSLGWRFGAGGGEVLPTGLSAVVLSLTLTFPIAFVPLLAQRIIPLRLLPPNYLSGAIVLMCAGILGHLLMYGLSSTRPGLKQVLMPVRSRVGFGRAMLVEVIYALVYFGLMGTLYRSFAQEQVAFPDLLVATKIAGAALVFVVGMGVFIAVRFPESLDDATWVQVRGFYSGLLLPVCLVGAMFG